MSECSLDKKECQCNSCKLTEWVVVYELALIIIILLFIYTELDDQKKTVTEEKTEN
ncbi:MAG: hypothetical protein AWM53_00069 [Candidatus Dichloromethanomonas elyunquensis]|nr:MAG: hypothetical protein AWM53_00069 [Candidatus Dichloromethanomonas elyunquensis]